VREMVSLSVLACFTPRHHLPSGVMLWPPDEAEMEVEVKLDIVCRGWDGSKRLESDHDEPVVSFLFLTTTPVPVLGIIICVFHSRVDTMPSLLWSSHFLFFHGATPLLSLVRLVRCSVAIGWSIVSSGSSFQFPTRVGYSAFHLCMLPAKSVPLYQQLPLRTMPCHWVSTQFHIALVSFKPRVLVFPLGNLTLNTQG
jgi:hypothetical protein